jgi:3-hydroxyisobutyrate dehydrogenase-like beta-hydroxyacid dehydrogenase
LSVSTARPGFGNDPGMTDVAVVGLGGMGSRIARRLLDAGHSLVVWNRTAAKAAPLVGLGASLAATPAEAASRAEVVITMVADPDALRAVTEGPDGVAAGVGEGLTVIEMSTVGPPAIERLASVVSVPLLDAPVLGSLGEVEAGTLSIFVGGKEAVFERHRALLEVLGRPLYLGPTGSGAAGKLVANSTLLNVIGAIGEALALGERLGLSLEAAFEVLGRTALAEQAERRRPALESGEFPPRFPLRLARKDGDLIADQHLDLRLTMAARSWLAEAQADGDGDLDYSAVLARIVEAVTRR